MDKLLRGAARAEGNGLSVAAIQHRSARDSCEWRAPSRNICVGFYQTVRRISVGRGLCTGTRHWAFLSPQVVATGRETPPMYFCLFCVVRVAALLLSRFASFESRLSGRSLAVTDASLLGACLVISEAGSLCTRDMTVGA